MGIYLNPEFYEFEETISSDIYIDKTLLIEELNKFIGTKQKYICVSRPRRFGKTMAMEMLSAYYSYGLNSKALFEGFKISRNKDTFYKHINSYDVIKLNIIEFMSVAKGDVEKLLKELSQNIIDEIMETYPEAKYKDKTNIMRVMRDAFIFTKRKFVILIDEWDCLFREYENDVTGHKEYLDFLRNWLKDQPFVGLAYMTGILPIKKYGVHSALNMFDEYSMNNPGVLAQFFGFTETEVNDLCDSYNLDFQQCKEWYDGYVLKSVCWNSDSKVYERERYEIYNPLSVAKSVKNGEFKNYWNKTETYEALKRYILLNMDGLREIIIGLIAGDRIKIDISSFSNDMTTFSCVDDVITLLIHLGYLGYDDDTKEVFVPNNEIRSEFAVSIKGDESWKIISEAIKKSDELLEATLQMNGEAVAAAIEKAHFETSILQYNDENALSYVISLAYYSARRKYCIFREMPLGKGFADMVFLPLPKFSDLPAMIVELKWDHDTTTALDQIRNNKYCDALKEYSGDVLLVGINYEKKANGKNIKRHQCKIERISLK